MNVLSFELPSEQLTVTFSFAGLQNSIWTFLFSHKNRLQTQMYV